MNAPALVQGSQKRALNEWPPSCYLLSSVFMFSFLETEKNTAAAAHTTPRAAAPVSTVRSSSLVHTVRRGRRAAY